MLPVASDRICGAKIGVHVKTFHRDPARLRIRSRYGARNGSTLW